MKERPIIFSAPMVQAILDGRKTQTRRVCKNNVRGNGFWSKSLDDFICENDYLPPSALLMDYKAGGHYLTTSDLEGWGEACRLGQPGDQLWVKETYWLDDEDGSILFAANQSDREIVDQNKRETGLQKFNWKPSIFMPRWASRIDLRINSVRVERLQDISEADAMAEGVPNSLHLAGGRFAKENFEHLWRSINGDGSWEANHWVWVITFERVKP